MNDDFQLFVGVDWATEEHEVCVLDASGRKVDARSFKHDGDGLAELCTWLLSMRPTAASARAGLRS